MGIVNEEEFLKESESKSQGLKGKFADLKKQGLIRAWVHPGANGLWERWRHNSIPGIVEYQKDGESIIECRWRFFNNVGKGKKDIPNSRDPLDAIVAWSNSLLDDGGSPSEPILKATLKNRDGQPYKVIYDVLDFSARDKKNRYKTNVMAKRGHVIPIISVKDRDPNNPVQIMDTVETIGVKFLQVKKRITDDFGAKRGNPFVFDPNDPGTYPVAFDFHYDKTKTQGSDMYNVTTVDRELTPVTEDVVAVMSGDLKSVYEIDLDKLTGPGDPEEMMVALESCWFSEVYPFEKFREYFLENRGVEPTNAGSSDMSEPADSVSQEQAVAAQSGAKCPSCGAAVKDAMKFCANCGTKVELPKSVPALIQTAGGSIGKQYKCSDPDCGAVVVPVGKEDRCPRCGVKVDMSPGVVTSGAVGLDFDDVPY